MCASGKKHYDSVETSTELFKNRDKSNIIPYMKQRDGAYGLKQKRQGEGMPSFPQRTVQERNVHSLCGYKNCNCSICLLGAYIVSTLHKTTDILLIFKCARDPELC